MQAMAESSEGIDLPEFSGRLSSDWTVHETRLQAWLRLKGIPPHSTEALDVLTLSLQSSAALAFRSAPPSERRSFAHSLDWLHRTYASPERAEFGRIAARNELERRRFRQRGRRDESVKDLLSEVEGFMLKGGVVDDAQKKNALQRCFCDFPKAERWIAEADTYDDATRQAFRWETQIIRRASQPLYRRSPSRKAPPPALSLSRPTSPHALTHLVHSSSAVQLTRACSPLSVEISHSSPASPSAGSFERPRPQSPLREVYSAPAPPPVPSRASQPDGLLGWALANGGKKASTIAEVTENLDDLTDRLNEFKLEHVRRQSSAASSMHQPPPSRPTSPTPHGAGARSPFYSTYSREDLHSPGEDEARMRHSSDTNGARFERLHPNVALRRAQSQSGRTSLGEPNFLARNRSAATMPSLAGVPSFLDAAMHSDDEEDESVYEEALVRSPPSSSPEPPTKRRGTLKKSLGRLGGRRAVTPSFEPANESSNERNRRSAKDKRSVLSRLFSSSARRERTAEDQKPAWTLAAENEAHKSWLQRPVTPLSQVVQEPSRQYAISPASGGTFGSFGTVVGRPAKVRGGATQQRN